MQLFSILIRVDNTAYKKISKIVRFGQSYICESLTMFLSNMYTAVLIKSLATMWIVMNYKVWVGPVSL